MDEGNETRKLITSTLVEVDGLMDPWAYTLAAITLFLIGFFGFFLNFIVIVIMCKDAQLWTPMNIILFNLVCSDFSVSFIGNPWTLSSAIVGQWIFGRTLCIAYGFFMSLLGITSITTLTVLSYERFCLVSCPISSRQLSRKGAGISILLIWIYSLSLTTPPLFGWGAYVNEAANISCSVNWESQTFNATSYIIFLFLMGLVIPVIVILYSYINIIRTMRENSARLGRVNRAEGRVTWMVAVMIVAFMVAWTPYAVFALLKHFGPSNLISPGIAVLPALIAKSSICYNPLIYVGMNTQYRAAWGRVWGNAQPKDTLGADTTANQTKSCSRISADCSTIIEKNKRRSKTKNDVTTTGNKSNQKFNILVMKKNEYEMSVIGNGRSMLINTNSYTTNLC